MKAPYLLEWIPICFLTPANKSRKLCMECRRQVAIIFGWVRSFVCVDFDTTKFHRDGFFDWMVLLSLKCYFGIFKMKYNKTFAVQNNTKLFGMPWGHCPKLTYKNVIAIAARIKISIHTLTYASVFLFRGILLRFYKQIIANLFVVASNCWSNKIGWRRIDIQINGVCLQLLMMVKIL